MDKKRVTGGRASGGVGDGRGGRRAAGLCGLAPSVGARACARAKGSARLSRGRVVRGEIERRRREWEDVIGLGAPYITLPTRDRRLRGRVA